jgi:hypothetical protein
MDLTEGEVAGPGLGWLVGDVLYSPYIYTMFTHGNPPMDTAKFLRPCREQAYRVHTCPRQTPCPSLFFCSHLVPQYPETYLGFDRTLG